MIPNFTILIRYFINLKNMQQKNKDENAAVFNDIKRQIYFWLGILIALICIGGFFLSSDWINDTYRSTMSELDNNDSDIGNILTQLTGYLLDFAIWLKALPVWTKIIGIIVGGAIAILNHDDQFD